MSAVSANLTLILFFFCACPAELGGFSDGRGRFLSPGVSCTPDTALDMSSFASPVRGMVPCARSLGVSASFNPKKDSRQSFTHKKEGKRQKKQHRFLIARWLEGGRVDATQSVLMCAARNNSHGCVCVAALSFLCDST